MQPKPSHLGPQYAAQYSDPGFAAAYPHRPPYPAEIFAILTGLITEAPRAVLDAGCGTGELARALAPLVDRVDAVDPAAGMLALGRTLPGGAAPSLHWVLGGMEDAPLRPPYALITAGDSLHWMEWSVVFPRFRAALSPAGYLALASREAPELPWDGELRPLLRRYSTNRAFRPSGYSLLAELDARGLFRAEGERCTAPAPFQQPVDAYVESLHARNGFSRDRMTAVAADAFDAAVRALVAPFAQDDGLLHLQVVGRVVWGRPQAP
ncbi:MAG TPA: class I SAM-dependent methyltransferase [Vicinamibacteria bacterium]